MGIESKAPEKGFYFVKDGVLVFVEHREGVLDRVAWEALAAGQKLARELGYGVSCVAIGKGAATAGKELAGAKVSESRVAEAEALNSYTADGYAAALKDIIGAVSPKWVIFNHTYQVRDFVPKLAALLDSGLASDCVGYRVEQGRVILGRQAFQGKFACDVELTGRPPYLVTFQAGVFREDACERQSASAPVQSVEIVLPADRIRSRPEVPFREAKQSVDLGQAEIIVAVGRGIKGPEALEVVGKLAEALGAEIAASRPVCDNGWLPIDRQVGSSGQMVAPKLYLALGISGAIQHQVGMKGSRAIVAVNKDAEAPIFEIADYGIVGDLFEVVPALTEEIKKLKTSG